MLYAHKREGAMSEDISSMYVTLKNSIKRKQLCMTVHAGNSSAQQDAEEGRD